MTACRDIEAGVATPEVMAELLNSMWAPHPRARLVRRDARRARRMAPPEGSGLAGSWGSGGGEDYAEDAAAGWGDLADEGGSQTDGFGASR